MNYDDHARTVSRLAESVYGQCLINNAERGAYVEHMIAPTLEKLQWRMTWPWAAWDFNHSDGARIEVKQSAARQSWHQRPDSEPLPKPSLGWFGIKKPSEGYFSEKGTWQDTRLQRHADIYVFAWHPVEDLRNADRRRRADHRRRDQWKFFVVAEDRLPAPRDGKADGITPGQLVKCDGAVHCVYEELAANVAKVRESLGSLKADVESADPGFR